MHKTVIYTKVDREVCSEVLEDVPKCGEDFCDACGDCLYCYEEDGCQITTTGEHVWVVYREYQEREMTDYEDHNGFEMDLVRYIKRQIEWSQKTFSEGLRTGGLSKHIKSELKEIAKAPTDVEEWIDIVILALDGAWRTGASPEEICEALEKKQKKNFNRKWPEAKSEDEPYYHLED